ncbi:hypothetical protein GALMADRAFT_251143 [Galerina marginata CBS 339.88]|uniref:Cytochrome b-c1 complex subunit 7 n=1 Tax=Galerina marginata (strain CBS 339.88) TaxID=685588 RepID=A0A067T3A4_GALM3|nr:hypothetical protein GALMADRAFT_251143 [Galerina marginata CBS 339.88]
MFGPLSLSLAPYVRSSRTLTKWVTPIANWYANAMGYRKYGFKYDDLLVEENPTVQRALSRLTPGENYDRTYRFKRASQASVLHAPLAKSEWMPVSEDVRYLEPHVTDVLKEDQERKTWDNLVVERK